LLICRANVMPCLMLRMIAFPFCCRIGRTM
jgi:hypothetical protein